MTQNTHQIPNPQIASDLCRLQPLAVGDAIRGHKKTTTNTITEENVPTNISNHSTIENAK
jgi:hypothetical protein